MQQKYQDAMCMCRNTENRLGSLHSQQTQTGRKLSIINVKETCHNRSELVCRVFYHKFKEFLRKRVDDGVIGELESYIYI